MIVLVFGMSKNTSLTPQKVCGQTLKDCKKKEARRAVYGRKLATKWEGECN